MLELREKLVARDELAEGRAIQQALLPKTTPSIPGFEVWLDTRPANDVGGDIVDVLEAEDGRFFLLLGDVAGKGLGAALLAARLQAAFRALAPDAPTLAAVGERLSGIFLRDGPSNRFATAVGLAGRPGEPSLRVVNAGHPPPLLVHRGQAVSVPGGGPALGIIAGARYTEHVVTLETGDTLVVYSDGVTEAIDPGGDFFGEERLVSTLLASATLSPAEIGRTIEQAVRAFEGGGRPHDDLSLILLRVA
jgi:sigma-B regulation protein RsbU (phosphoserine phosphatase)